MAVERALKVGFGGLIANSGAEPRKGRPKIGESGARRGQGQMTIWTSSPEWRARATKVARGLREMGFSYEEIPDHMPDADGATPAPWEVYGFANPSKVAGARSRRGRPDTTQANRPCRRGWRLESRRTIESPTVEADGQGVTATKTPLGQAA